MSSHAAVFTALVFAAWVVVAIWWTARSLRNAADVRDRIIADARTGVTPPAPDNVPGINLADQDECELLWSVPAHTPRDLEFDAGCARLLEAVRDEQNGEADDA